MKTFKKLTITFLFLFATLTISAQSKIAHINSQALIMMVRILVAKT